MGAIDWEIVKIIAPWFIGLIGVIASMVIYMSKTILNKIKQIEDRQIDFTTHEDVRRLIFDKVDPLSKRMDRMEHQLDNINNKLDSIKDLLISLGKDK